jgi:hypothetical protein
MSKLRHEGQPGGCGDCRNRRKVYNDKGLQICLHHDVITPERLIEQRARLAHLKEKIGDFFLCARSQSGRTCKVCGKFVYTDVCGGVKHKDGQDAYDPRDISKIPRMNTKACEAWLNERTEGTFVARKFLHPLVDFVKCCYPYC